jgi:hypothetical protein
VLNISIVLKVSPSVLYCVLRRARGVASAEGRSGASSEIGDDTTIDNGEAPTPYSLIDHRTDVSCRIDLP